MGADITTGNTPAPLSEISTVPVPRALRTGKVNIVIHKSCNQTTMEIPSVA